MAPRLQAKHADASAMRSSPEDPVLAPLSLSLSAAQLADRREATRDNAAFFIVALLNNLVFTVYLSAAEDLLENSAGVILLFNVLPGLLVKILAALFAHRLSYTLRVCLTALGLCASCLVVALVEYTPVRLGAIGLSSCAGTLGEITFLSLSSRYRPATVGAWSSGTGFAGFSGAFIYHFLRADLGLGSREAVLLLAPLSLGMLVSYFCLLTPARGDALYAAIPASDDRLEDAAAGVESGGSDGVPLVPGYEPVVFDPPPPGMSAERAAFPWLLRAYIAPLMLVYVFEYTINQGISPTLDTFTSDKVVESDLSRVNRSHLYTLYQTAYQTGVFISRSSIEFVKFPRIWLFPFIQFCNCALLLAGALFRLIPHRYIVFCVMLFEGLIGGGMYVNAFYKLRKTVPKDLNAWALGAASVGDALGITLAALINIFLECGIRRLRGEGTCDVST